MGMYTEIYVNVDLKEDTPREYYERSKDKISLLDDHRFARGGI